MHRPGFTIRRTFAAALLLGAATAAPILALGAAATPASASTPACTTSGLVVWMNTAGSGAAGSIYYNLEFTNQSGHACTLLGYPGVSAVNLAGHQLGSAGGRNPTHAAKLITLANQATASSVLQIVEAGNYPSSKCGQTSAAGVLVYPPGQTSAKIVPFPFAACTGTSPRILAVEPVIKGTGQNN